MTRVHGDRWNHKGGWLFVAFFLLPLSVTSHSSTDFTEAQGTEKLKALQKQIIEAQSNLKYANTETKRLHEQLQKTELKLADKHRQLRTLQTKVSHLARELRQFKERREQLKKDSQSQLQQLNAEVAIAYRLGQQEPLKLLLNIEDPYTLNRTLKYYDYFLSARAREIDKYRSALAEIGHLTEQINTQRDKLINERKTLAREEDRLGKSQKQREQLLASFRQQYVNEQLRLDNLQAEKNHLQSLVENIQRNSRRVATTSSFAGQKGKLPWPVKGRLLSAFGDKRASTLNWSGWLLDSTEGNPVQAVYSGTVVFSDYLRGHGLLIIIDHGNGYLSLYAHNQSLTQTIGQQVEQGSTIARVGNSGGLKNSALYFEIRHQGKAVNPKIWLERRS